MTTGAIKINDSEPTPTGLNDEPAGERESLEKSAFAGESGLPAPAGLISTPANADQTNTPHRCEIVVTNVYIVTSGEYSDYQIHAVFSTREAADAYVEAAKTTHRYYDVSEWPLDTTLPPKTATIYHVMLDAATGNMRWNWVDVQEVSGERYSAVAYETWHTGGPAFKASSSVGMEHAHKLAVEGRQKHLRESGVRS